MRRKELLVSLTLLLLGGSPLETLHAGTPAATVAITAGGTSVERQGQRLPLDTGTELERGDRIETGMEGRVTLLLANDVIVAMGVASSLRLTDPAHIALAGGRVEVTVPPSPRGTPPFAIETPAALARVTGTKFFVIHDPVTGRSRIVTIKGSVRARKLDGVETEEVTVRANFQVAVAPQLDTLTVEPADPTEIEQLTGEVEIAVTEVEKGGGDLRDLVEGIPIEKPAPIPSAAALRPPGAKDVEDGPPLENPDPSDSAIILEKTAPTEIFIEVP